MIINIQYMVQSKPSDYSGSEMCLACCMFTTTNVMFPLICFSRRLKSNLHHSQNIHERLIKDQMRYYKKHQNTIIVKIQILKITSVINTTPQGEIVHIESSFCWLHTVLKHHAVCFINSSFRFCWLTPIW